MDIAARSLKIKRDVISKLLDEGLYPYTKRYLGTFNNHFSTIGLIGMNEVGLNAVWLGEDLSHAKTQEFTKEVLNHMRERLVEYQEQYGDLYNLEATPAESTTYRLAKHDRERWPDIKTAGKEGDTPYYTNSLAAAMNAPVSVMETAGEGGAWGIALLASYMLQKKDGESLADYLDSRVFADSKAIRVEPDTEDVAGFETFMKRYQAGLAIERAAVESLAD